MNTIRKVTLRSLINPSVMYLSVDSGSGALVFNQTPFVWDFDVTNTDEFNNNIMGVIISFTNERGDKMCLKSDFTPPLSGASVPAIVAHSEIGIESPVILTREESRAEDVYHINAIEADGDITFYSLEGKKSDMTQPVFGNGVNYFLVADA